MFFHIHYNLCNYEELRRTMFLLIGSGRGDFVVLENQELLYKNLEFRFLFCRQEEIVIQTHPIYDRYVAKTSPF